MIVVERWVLRRTTTTFRRSLKSFDGSVQFVSFRNQQSEDLFCGHPENRNMVDDHKSAVCPLVKMERPTTESQ